MASIERWRGQAAGRNRAVAYRDLVWTVATAPGTDVREQAPRVLAALDRNLADAGTDRTRLVSATVYLADMATKPALDEAWNAWIGPDPDHWPQRACVGAALADGCLVEIVVLAARR